jgi:hypothetical protein
MHFLSTIKNLASRLGSPVARAMQRPYIVIDAKIGQIFLSDVTEDLEFFVLKAFAKFSARNESPVATTIRLGRFDMDNKGIKVERAFLGIGQFFNEHEMSETLDVGGGKTVDGKLIVRLLTNRKNWPSTVTAGLHFVETYGTKIEPVLTTMSFSEEKPPSGGVFLR